MALSIHHRSGYGESELVKITASLVEYIGKLKQVNSYGSPEGFLHLPADTGMIEGIQQTGADYIVIAGIGGSSQGAAALASALRPGKLFILDAIDPIAVQELQQKTQGKKTAVFFISQSGATLETNKNIDAISPLFSDIAVITNEGSPLWTSADQKGWKKIATIPAIPGRFSLFSPVALVPLAALGIDIKKMCEAAAAMQETCLNPDIRAIPALWSAAETYVAQTQGKTIHALFALHPALLSAAKWWQQLEAESLGKNGKGILPIVAGPTDLHSLAQYFFDGPNLTYTTFLSAKADEVTQGIVQGVQTAYEKKQLPFSAVAFEDFNEADLGAFCAMKMLETVYLAKLMGVSAFDQPGVELYKQEVKTILNL